MLIEICNVYHYIHTCTSQPFWYSFSLHYKTADTSLLGKRERESTITCLLCLHLIKSIRIYYLTSQFRNLRVSVWVNFHHFPSGHTGCLCERYEIRGPPSGRPTFLISDVNYNYLSNSQQNKLAVSKLR